jgi:hypothetical protein
VAAQLSASQEGLSSMSESECNHDDAVKYVFDVLNSRL